MIKVVQMRRMLVILSDCGTTVYSLVFRKDRETIRDILDLLDDLWNLPTKRVKHANLEGVTLWETDVVLRYKRGIATLMIGSQSIPIAREDLDRLYDKLTALVLDRELKKSVKKPVKKPAKDVLMKPSAEEKAKDEAREKAEREVPRTIAEDLVALENIKDEGGPPTIIHSMLVDLIEGHGTHRTLLITPETMAQIKRDAGIRMITKRTRLCINALLWERELRLVHKSGRYFLGRKDSVENMSPDTAVNPV